MVIKITAAILEKINNKLSIINNIQIPKLNKNQILVKIKYSSICGSQIFEISGGRNNNKFLPHMLGHEGTGIIVAKHKNVKKLKIGDKVFLTWISKKNIKNYSTNYINPINNKKINSGEITTFSNYSIISKNKIFKLPKKISFRDGIFLGCCLPTGAGIVLKHLIKKPNKKICIIGIGGVGLWALLTCIYFNFRDIVVIEKNLNRMQKINKIINKKKIKYFDTTYTSYFKKNYSNYFDYVIECSGTSKLIQKSIYLIKNNGKVIFASHPSKNEKIQIDPFELIKGKVIKGSWGGEINFNKDIKILCKILIYNKNIIKKLFAKTYSLNLINKAIQDMKSGISLRSILKIT
jgi:S-(hydroxymethyl)glutathione dehydrogenase/alcohol dehydrogenase